MRSAALRLRLVLIAAPVAHGCSGSPAATAATSATTVTVLAASAGPARSTEVPYTPLRPATSASAAKPAASLPGWSVGEAVCVSAERTERDETPPGHEAGTFHCGHAITAAALDEFCTTFNLCGRRFQAFSRRDTEQTRDEHPDGCCYLSDEVMIGRPLVIAARWRKAPLVHVIGWGA